MTTSLAKKLAALAMGAVVASAGAAAAAAGSLVYVPTGESAEVVIIDAATATPVGRISGLPAAHGLAVTPDGSRLIVGSFDERTPGSAMPAKPAGVSAADHAAHHGGGSKPASQAGESTVSIVDTATREVVRRIDVPGAVHHVAVSPDGKFAAVTHPGADAVTAIDLDSYDVVRTVPTGAQPNYAVFSPDGARLYVSDAGDDSVAVVDTQDWEVATRIGVGESPEHLALSPDGSRLFVNNVAGGSVSIIDLAAQQVIETLPVGEVPHGIDVSDDGTTLYVALRGEDKLAAVDLTTRTWRSTRLTPAPYHLAVLRGAGVLYVSSAEESRIWILDAATLEPLGEIPVPGIGHQFAQVPAG
jgi:YVTN family beta-propeller protein